MEDNHHIECQYCFGAKELTKDGKLLMPCPICQGGELKDEKLAKANKLWLRYLKEDFDNFKEEDL